MFKKNNSTHRFEDVEMDLPEGNGPNEGSSSDTKWKPTDLVFNSFRSRDAELAHFNLLILMKDSSPQSMTNIKGMMAHSPETVERVIYRAVGDGIMRESNGQFSL
jgi:hypothetical protein